MCHELDGLFWSNTQCHRVCARVVALVMCVLTYGRCVSVSSAWIIYFGASVVNQLFYSRLIRYMYSFTYLVIVPICVPFICNLYLDLSIDVNGVSAV